MNQSVATLESRVASVTSLAHETEIRTFTLFEAAKEVAQQNKTLNDRVKSFLAKLYRADAASPGTASKAVPPLA